jgi:hypothetical protein
MLKVTGMIKNLIASLRRKGLKGSKHEKFVAGILTQIRLVWIGELQ